MAKKRKRSPDAESRKRSRTGSSTVQNQRVLRAKSVFRGDQDPYYPSRSGSQGSLPTSGDYAFRMKVLCSVDPVPDEIFKHAVQGIVKTCFPNGILQELGIDAVQQHMLEGGAPEVNISRMRDSFRSEMVHRVAWLFAEHLDTSEKAEMGIASVIAATNRLHGNKLDIQVLDEIIGAFSLLKTDLEKGSSGLSQGAGLAIPGADDALPSQEHLDETDLVNGSDVNKQNPRVSKSWSWDIDATGFTIDMVPECFKRQDDLFAYHALPLVRTELGPRASRKEIRIKMIEMLTDLSEDECEKWRESYVKLQEGNLDMLKRVATPVNGNTGRSHTPTAASSRTDHLAASAIQRTSAMTDNRESRKPSVHIKVEQPAVIERPANLEDDGSNRRGTGVDDTVTAFQRLSTDGVQTASQQPGKGDTDHATPIIDLLIGSSSIKPLPKHPYKPAFGCIMQALEDRIPEKTISLRYFGGKTTTYSIDDLKRRTRPRFESKEGKIGVERMLRMWVTVNIECFPELVQEPFVFVNLQPHVTTVTDLFIPTYLPLPVEESQKISEMILLALEVRGVNTCYQIEGKDVKMRLLGILASPERVNKKRGQLEVSLRSVAVQHRHNFKDLKNTALVREWEKLTSQKW